jgi:hypothetical protein
LYRATAGRKAGIGHPIKGLSKNPNLALHSHSTRQPKDGCQAAGYKPDKARAKIATPHIVWYARIGFSWATQYGD